MSVLSHLALQFSSHPENIATEALAYVLNKSPASHRGLTSFVSTLSGRDLEIHGITTQLSNDDNSRPDLCGINSAGERTLLIEVKFWAGLTDAQPCQYLRMMTQPGVLLFVAPQARLTMLWHELLRRIELDGGAVPSSAFGMQGGQMRLEINSNILVATSWRELLHSLEHEAAASSETQAAADIRQLQALCERMDTDAFLPLTSEELTSSLGRRVLQFEQLSIELTERLKHSGLADTTGLRTSAGIGYCGSYLRLRGNNAFLGFSANSWASFGQSPIWLELSGSTWNPSTPPADIKRALSTGGIPFWERAKVCVPILLKTNCEREAVIAAAIAELTRIALILPDGRGAAPIVPPEAPPST